jgi:hypothetical protein
VQLSSLNPSKKQNRIAFADVDDFAKALESVWEGNTTILYRMRLSCSFYDSDGSKVGNDRKGP